MRESIRPRRITRIQVNITAYGAAMRLCMCNPKIAGRYICPLLMYSKQTRCEFRVWGKREIERTLRREGREGALQTEIAFQITKNIQFSYSNLWQANYPECILNIWICVANMEHLKHFAHIWINYPTKIPNCKFAGSDYSVIIANYS